MDKNLAEEGNAEEHLSLNAAINSIIFLHALMFSGVLEEAEFYNIASLVRLVKERIRDNENRTSQVG